MKFAFSSSPEGFRRSTCFCHTRFGKNEDIYVWPSATAKLVLDWTEADIESMRGAGYTDADIRAFEEQIGGYAGWRAGINADGKWVYFISGD
jgi:hypothetical protein